jgi:hypothetical protein
MRYATIAPNGRILGIFTCEPDLLSDRPKPDDAIFVECPTANAVNSYWSGNEFVDKQPSGITHTVDGNTVTITGLPDNAIINVTLPDRYEVYQASTEFSISLPGPGGYVFQIDPWPYLKKTFAVLIEG